MADLMLGLREQLGRRASLGIHEEQRIVSESVCSARLVNDPALNRVARSEEHAAALVGEGEHADESGRASLVANIGKLAKQQGVVVGVALAAMIQLRPAGAV